MSEPGQKQPVGYYIARFYWLARRFYDAELKHLGFGHGSMAFLLIVYRHGSITQNEISTCLHTDKANTARAIRKLHDLGYVKRYRDPDDLRTKIVQLTPRGAKIIPEVKEIVAKWDDILTGTFDAEEYDNLYSLFQTMLKNINKQ